MLLWAGKRRRFWPGDCNDRSNSRNTQNSASIAIKRIQNQRKTFLNMIRGDH